MKPTILLFGLIGALLLTGLVSAEAFNMNKYLFEDEKIDDVTYVSVEIDNIEYRLVYIKEDPIFILKEGNLITDKNEVKDLACDCWKKLYYPSEKEVEELKNYIINFNAGRHEGVQYKAPPLSFSDAEGYCDKVTYMDQEIFPGHKGCIGETECIQLANLMCNMIDPTHQMGCDASVLGKGFHQYSKGKNEMDESYKEIMTLFDGISSSNIAERLNKYESLLDEIEDAGETLVKNSLRLPTGNILECKDCVGFCPEIPLNFEVIEEAREKVKELKLKVVPLKDEDEKVKLISENTEDRIWYSEGKTLYPKYNQKYKELITEQGEIFNWAEETLKTVVNGELAGKYNSAKLLKDDLENQLDTYRFKGEFEQQIHQLKTQLESIEELQNQSLTLAYDNAEEARLKTTNRLIRARWYVDDSNEELVSELNEIGVLYNQYLAGYILPLSDTQYESQEIRFNELADRLDSVISKSPNGRGSLTGVIKTTGRETTKTVYSLIGASMVEDNSLTPVIPALLIVIVNFILIGLSIMVFLSIAKANAHIFRKKIVMTSWVILFILFIGILIIGSIAVYNIMTGTTGIGDYESFEYSLKDTEQINIVIDERGAYTGVITSMDKCADLVKAQLENKNIKEYRFSGTQCASPTGIKSIEECEMEFGLIPTYVFEYNTDTSGYSFQNTYGNDATTFGQIDIFDKCEIGYAIYLEE
ncbi:hypothetical protein KO317_01565 [Candidatus Micrarchaeota archaeon]|nr:hypothetical protein [Candidatus Micrarchaeota archaeon]